jgi:hypothetical protein
MPDSTTSVGVAKPIRISATISPDMKQSIDRIMRTTANFTQSDIIRELLAYAIRTLPTAELPPHSVFGAYVEHARNGHGPTP